MRQMRSKLSLTAFAKYIGGYTAAMNGVDGIAFTAGIGENDSTIQKMVCGYLGYLGVILDEEANNTAWKGLHDLNFGFQS